MAKFYTRYMTTAATPSPVNNTVFYGYRGPNYTVNGQFYTSSTNVKQLDNFQTSSNCAYAECQDRLAILTADSVFEPGLMANAFDLLGSKLPSEYSSGIFQSYGTWRTSRDEWTFKNMAALCGACFQVQTSNATACLEGCVCPGGAIRGEGFVFNFWNCCTQYYSCSPNFHRIEKPSGTFNCFQPWSFGAVTFCSQCAALYYSCCFQCEPTLGNTIGCYFMHAPCGCSYSCSGYTLYPGAGALSGSPCCAGPVVGFERMVYPTSCLFSTTGRSDQHVFGSHTLYPGICSTSCYSMHVVGSQPYYGACTGANEAGVRVFLSRSSAHTFYMFYDATKGGIQGVDNATDTSYRLSLKNYNHGTNTTTVMSYFKKGISGLVIPSNPDLDTTTNYRFYMIGFNGADTATQTVSIYRPSLDLSTGSATVGSAYTLTMTAGEQQALYADLGHNNTGASLYDSADFRRTTVNRIWYSTDTNNVKRLHLGIYNTNATGFVTSANAFNDPNSRGKMFKIYSWSLNDAGTSATYLGKVDLSAYAPRYFFPLDNNWRIIYSGASFTNDIILSLNATTGLYQYQNTMPYIANRLFKDRDGRWSVQMSDVGLGVCNGMYSNYIDILTSDVGQTLVVSAATTAFTYTGTTINSNVTVNVYDYLGNRIAKQVSLTVVGATATPGVTFSGGAYSTTINTSNSADTVVPIQVISSTSAKIVGTVTENL